jgi:hypothetical protein
VFPDFTILRYNVDMHIDTVIFVALCVLTVILIEIGKKTKK